MDQSNSTQEKSTFVTVLAWIFIVIGGFATFIGILQNIMIHTIFPKHEMSQAMEQANQSQDIPAFAQFMFNNFDLLFLMVLVVSATCFISAIALLKRKNWARIVFIVLMSLGIAWNVFGLIAQFTFFSTLPDMGGENIPPEFETMMSIMKFATVLMVIAFSALQGYVIKKLCTQNIKDEFA
jgi:hypothetical protein